MSQFLNPHLPEEVQQEVGLVVLVVVAVVVKAVAVAMEEEVVVKVVQVGTEVTAVVALETVEGMAAILETHKREGTKRYSNLFAACCCSPCNCMSGPRSQKWRLHETVEAAKNTSEEARTACFACFSEAARQCLLLSVCVSRTHTGHRGGLSRHRLARKRYSKFSELYFHKYDTKSQPRTGITLQGPQISSQYAAGPGRHAPSQ